MHAKTAFLSRARNRGSVCVCVGGGGGARGGGVEGKGVEGGSGETCSPTSLPRVMLCESLQSVCRFARVGCNCSPLVRGVRERCLVKYQIRRAMKRIVAIFRKNSREKK